MPPTRIRCASCVLAAILSFPLPSLAFETPLSDTAVREAYFLGQRRDETMARFLDKYTKHLPPPATGPHVYSVTLLTPFVLLVEFSSRQSNYSAQQAEKDHHSEQEMVSIQAEILLTKNYGPFIAKPTGSRSGSPMGLQLRPANFWRMVKFHVYDAEKEIPVSDITGEPHFLCSDDGCLLTGATVELQLSATAFSSETATIEINPPEGDQVTVDFDLASLR